MRPNRVIVTAWIIWMSLAGAASAADQRIAVEKKPVTIERKTFDPRNPPAEMPPLNEGEAAQAVFNFSCQTHSNYSYTSKKRDGQCVADIALKSHKVTISLKITIWLPNGATEKLRAHEEGHKEIGERFYATAEKEARQIAEQAWRGKIEASGSNCEAASKKKVSEIDNAVCSDFLKRVSAPSGRVGDIYDELTAHGTNDLGEADAIKQAFERWEKEKSEEK